MADRYVRGVGGNWNAAGTWESTPGGGEVVAIPTNADQVYLVIGSGQLTINANAVCRAFDCTGYANTITHNANISLTVGDATAPAGNLALKLEGTYSPNNDGSSIVFASSGAGVHTVDLAGKTTGNLTFSGTASFQMQNSWTMRSATATLSHTAGTLDINGKTMTNGVFSTSGATARTITFGAAAINSNATSAANAFSYSGSNLTITANTCIVTCSGGSYGIATNNADWNGLSFIIAGAAGSCAWGGGGTVKDVIFLNTATKTFQVQASTTITLTGNFYCYGTNVKFVTIISNSAGTAFTLSKTSGTVNVYGCSIKDSTASGGATFNAPLGGSVSGNTGWNFIEANKFTFYVDGTTGIDTTTDTPLGWWSVAYTGATGTAPAVDEVVTGATSESTAKICGIVNLYEWGIGAGTMYFYGKSAAFQAETVNCAGGGAFTIGADFVYCAWKTLTVGASAARLVSGRGDTIRMAKSPNPTSMGQSAQWTGATGLSGGTGGTKTVSGTANDGGLIRITTSGAHGYVTGDVVLITAIVGTIEANSEWVVTYIDATHFNLQGSAYVNAWISGGTVYKKTVQAVVLTTAVTKTIHNCDTAWSGGASCTVTAENNAREGAKYQKIVTGALGAGQELSYVDFGSQLDFSNLSGASLQQISFWFWSNVTVAAGDLKIVFWSDAARSVQVDSFNIPAILVSSSAWCPITIDKGSALSSTVRAISVVSTVAIASKTFYFDNFIACKASSAADSLNLASLISKNSSIYGGTEPWLGIQSIKDTIIILDQDVTPNDQSTVRGYGGVTESVPIYKRETVKSETGGWNTVINSVNQSGSAVGGNMDYEGGYNPVDNTQDGETFLDGMNGNGYSMDIDSKSYVTMNRFSSSRYYYGFYINSSNHITLNFQGACNNQQQGCYFNSTTFITSTTLGNCCNNGGDGLKIVSANNSSITTIGNLWSNGWNSGAVGLTMTGTSYGVYITTINSVNNNTSGGIGLTGYNNWVGTISDISYNAGSGFAMNACYGNRFGTFTKISYNNGDGYTTNSCQGNIANSITANNNNGFGLNLGYAQSNNNYVKGGSTTANVSGGISAGSYVNYIRNFTINEATKVAGLAVALDSRLYSENDGYYGTHYVYTDYGYIASDATVRHTASGISWKIAPTNVLRSSFYPLNLVIARVCCSSGNLVTVKVWMKKSHATYVVGRLLCRAGQLSGITTDKTATKADDTNWEELTITFTPTEAGTVEIEAQCWIPVGSASTTDFINVDDMTITQA
ncbi:MAG: hypothetical protein WC208_08190 [Gallionella sp.]|jgi:hypothetical protein